MILLYHSTLIITMRATPISDPLEPLKKRHQKMITFYRSKGDPHIFAMYKPRARPPSIPLKAPTQTRSSVSSVVDNELNICSLAVRLFYSSSAVYTNESSRTNMHSVSLVVDNELKLAVFSHSILLSSEATQSLLLGFEDLRQDFNGT
jgi:hypothetical protein